MNFDAVTECDKGDGVLLYIGRSKKSSFNPKMIWETIFQPKGQDLRDLKEWVSLTVCINGRQSLPSQSL